MAALSDCYAAAAARRQGEANDSSLMESGFLLGGLTLGLCTQRQDAPESYRVGH